jgi:hypothetical protein
MKRIILAVLMFVCLIGCEKSPIIEDKKDIQRGELRHKFFVECMELAAKLPRQSDDDVHKIINSCSDQAWYMANQMSN